MATVTVDQADRPHPPFASLISSRLPIEFLRGVRPLIDSSYESAYQGAPDNDNGLPYWKNVQPHQRNRRVFEGLHNLAEELGLSAVAKKLENGYNYLEIESKGLSVHVKHFNNYQPLKEQMVKADYRRQMTGINAPYGQMPLFPDGRPIEIPDEFYVIMFYKDGATNASSGSIFFIFPSNEEGNDLANCEIEEAIAAFVPIAESAPPVSDDIIDLPPKKEDDEEEKKAE